MASSNQGKPGSNQHGQAQKSGPNQRQKGNQGGELGQREESKTESPPGQQGGAARKGERPIADVDRKVRGGDA
jgi:hypothetical protein